MRADGDLLSRRATLLAISGVLLGMLLAALIPELPLRRTVREVPA